MKISDGDCVRIDIANFELTLLKSALRNDKRGGLLLHLRLRLLLLLWALGLGLWLLDNRDRFDKLLAQPETRQSNLLSA